MIDKIKAPLFFILLLIWHSTAYSAVDVHFSKYRFVFDNANRKDSILITNRGLDKVSCTNTFADFIMTEKGPTKIATLPSDVPNSAKNLLRRSPKNITIAPNSSQVVRLSSRRRPGINDGEYLSYLKVVCHNETEEEEKNDQVITIKPVFNYYFPAHVRVGKTTAATSFENAKIIKNNKNSYIIVDQVREGSRSVIGDIKVIDKSNGDILGKANSVAIYMPFSKKSHKIRLTSPPKGKVELVFTESKLTLGDLVSRVDIN